MIIKKIILKSWPLVILLVSTLLITWPIFLPGYFSHHDDLQVMRIFEMRKCLEDFQIPCRWVPDMGYGNGYPLFNYYAVLPYYIGALFSFLLGFLTSAKLLFAIPIFLGAVSMFFLSRELFGIYPGIIASILFTYAPYRALDLYVRGDISESFAISTIPFVFYFALKLIKSGKVRYLVGLSLSLAVFLTSHNIMTILFAPVFLLVVLYWLMIEKRYFLRLIIGLLIGIGLSAFFILPAYFEKNLVQIDNLIKFDLDFRAHFVALDQLLFSRFWGYGASVPGPHDTISFQIGWPYWWIVLASFVIFLVSKKSKLKFSNLLPILLLGVFLISVFMTHIKSVSIWEKIDILKFTQFPWRFLALSTFSSSLLGAYFVKNLKLINEKYITVFLVILTIFLNWNYFKPKEFYPKMTDQEKLSGKLLDDQKKAVILDYLPKTAVEPREPAPDKPILMSGNAAIGNFMVKSNSWQFQTNVTNNASIEVPVLDFPNWVVTLNGRPVNFSNKNYLGRISINFQESGQYFVLGRFTDTPLRQYSNTVSLLALLCLLFVGFYAKINKKFR